MPTAKKKTSTKATGRPTKYTAAMCDTAREYFANPQAFRDIFPTVSGLAVVLGVNRSTIYEWAKHHPAFSNTLKNGEDQQVRQMANHMMNKEVYSGGSVFVAKNILGWTDKQEVKQETVNTVVNIVKDEQQSDL